MGFLAFVLGVGVVPHRVCERDAGPYFEGDVRHVDALAASVAGWTGCRGRARGATLTSVEGDGAPLPIVPSRFLTGSRRFDQEWLFGTYVMAAMGFGQIALESPRGGERFRENVERMEECLSAVLSPDARAFDREAWGNDALDFVADVTNLASAADVAKRLDEAGPHADATASTTSADRGHVAYLGYAGLALGLHRMLVPSSRFDVVHDALVAALARRILASSSGFVETYPGELYPVDNASAMATLALHRRSAREVPATNAALERGLATLRRCAVDSTTGLLVQSLPSDLREVDCRDSVFEGKGPTGRGSGTALAAYFLAWTDSSLASELHRAVRRELYRTVIGFGVVLEHPEARGATDIDSGPTLFGFGVSATGFSLGASRMNDDRESFEALYATTHLFGAPWDDGSSRTFTTGGPLGDAIVFAMVTAPRPSFRRAPEGA